MAKNRSEKADQQDENGQEVASIERPRSVEIASSGISTSTEAGQFLSAIISDVMTEEVPHRRASVAISAMDKMLKLFALQHKYGAKDKALVLANGKSNQR